MRTPFLLGTLSLGLLAVLALPASAQELPVSGYVKGSGPTVYWLNDQGYRYVFPDETVLQSWLTSGNTQGQVLDDMILAEYPVAGNMTVRPGTRLIRFDSDPTMYVVARGAVLRRVDEALASAFYGTTWEARLETLPVTLFANYQLGTPVTYSSDFDANHESSLSASPDDDIHFRLTNGTLPGSKAPLKAKVEVMADPVVVHPPDESAVVSYLVKVSEVNTAISNLRTELYREKTGLIKICRGIDICRQDVNYQLVTKALEDRFYAIVSNEKGEKLSSVYSPIVSVQPIPMSTP